MNPMGWIVVPLANFKVALVGFNSPIPILLKRDKGIKLILAHKSHMALSMASLPITQGIEKLPGSPTFGGNFLMIALLSLVKVIVSLCSIAFFFEKIFLINLAYRGIRVKASAKGILKQIFLSILINFLNCASKEGLARPNGKGILVLSRSFHSLS